MRTINVPKDKKFNDGSKIVQREATELSACICLKLGCNEN
jgi:hypothetical protein